MPLQHLHLTIPVDGAVLEARLYSSAAITTAPSSSPKALADIDPSALPRATRLVTAAHPWSRLGGNMLFPVLSHHLPSVLCADPTTALLTFNARSVGLSTGSQPIPGFGGGEGEDFAAIEKAMSEALGVEEVWRVGYSHGTIAALTAPPHPGLKGTLLISPAPTLFRLLTLFRGPSFSQGLEAALDRDDKLSLVYGTADDFTGVSTFTSLGGSRSDKITKTPIEGCGHFYIRAEDGQALQEAVKAWITSPI